jgi:biopolymer transport protein ExbB
MKNKTVNVVQSLFGKVLSMSSRFEKNICPIGITLFCLFLLPGVISGIESANGQTTLASLGQEKVSMIGPLSVDKSIIDSESEGLLKETATPIEVNEGASDGSMLENSLIPIFMKGGPIMWPLVLASILALGTVIDRIFFLISIRRKRNGKAITKFLAAVGKGDTQSAIRISEESNCYVVRTLNFALSHKGESLANALLFAQEQEMKRFRRGIPMLDTIITLAPLLGLLGTVTGMMGSFAVIGGDLSTPGAVTGGIAEALIATAFGLGIAITSLIPFNFLNNKMEEARMEIESAATQLELLTHPESLTAISQTRQSKRLIVDDEDYGLVPETTAAV